MNQPRLLLQREPSKDGATLGKLYDKGEYLMDVLEDEVRERPGVPVTEWKVHSKTAIPQGIYEIVLQDSPRFGPDTLTLTGVSGFQYIRIHAGNQSSDTEGCLLVGHRNSASTIKNSRINLSVLKVRLLPALKSGEVVLIQIANAGMEA
jgi:hypothetical protein